MGLDRELIESYKSAMPWQSFEERFTVVKSTEKPVDPRVRKHGFGLCRICGHEFGKLTKNSTVCQSKDCRIAVNSEYQRRCRDDAYKARQAKAQRERVARRKTEETIL